MSLDAIKREVAALNPESQQELLRYLVGLRKESWEPSLVKTSSRLDDPNVEWLTPEEFKKRLDAIPEPTDE